jgi:hypothetical protein
MSYFLDLISPETYEAFSRSDRSISGFRQRHLGISRRVNPGDRQLCYLAGAADERQHQVMSDRERWFRVVMGQEAVAKLITRDSSTAVRLPDVVANDLGFKLDLGHERKISGLAPA